MRKLVIATLICFTSMFTVLAVPMYGPPAPLIPNGKDAIITVADVDLVRQKKNYISAFGGGGYNYDKGCTFLKVTTQYSWPIAGGGVGKSALTIFEAPEAQSLPTAPVFSTVAVLPNLAANTAVTLDAKIYVTKPDPRGGAFPPIPITESGSKTVSAPPRNQDVPLE